QQLEADVLVIVIVAGIGFEREHVRLHEAARAETDVLDLGGKGKVHASILRFGGWCRSASPSLFGKGTTCHPRNATIWPPSTTMVAPPMKRPAAEAGASTAPP